MQQSPQAIPVGSGEALVRVHTLGRFLVETEGQPLRFEAKAKRKPLELLKVLIALGGTSVSTEQIIESLWPDSDGDRAHSAFATTLGRLRKLVGAAPLTLQDGRLTLVDRLCWVDALAFPALLGQANKAMERGEPAAAWEWLERAMELYRGPFLDGEFEPPELLSAREKLHGIFLRHLTRLASAFREKGDFQQAAELCQKGLEVDDLAEELYQQLMRCHLEQSRLVEASAVYQRCRQLFQASVGIDPSPETEAIHQAVLAAQAARNTAGPAPVEAPAPQRAALSAAANRPAVSQPAESRPTSSAGVAPAASDAVGVAASPPVSAPAPADLDGIRRTATVTAFKLHGFTALNERLDPEEVEHLLSRIRTGSESLIVRHGGVLNQCILDEQVALFGIPAAHEDDPLRAVEATLAVQALVREIGAGLEARIGQPLRIQAGICTGLVLASPRDAREGNFSLAGNTVWLANALVGTASADEIMVGPETRHQIEPYFATEALAGLPMQGRERPVPRYRVTGRTGVRTRIEAAEQHGLTPFMGRESELGLLRAALEQALAGNGQLITVVGDPGLGKSRLLHEFAASLDRTRCTMVECRAQATGGDTPYLPFREGLARVLGVRSVESPAEAVNAARSALQAIDPALETYLPLYLYLLSIAREDFPLLAELSGEALSRALSEALVALSIHSTRRRPVVLILEDWHWADSASMDALRRLTGLMPSYALLVIVTHRPEFELNWGRLSFHRELPLRPLGSEHTGEIVRAALGARNLPAGLLERIQEHTGGNPFFVEEICAALLEDGSVRVTGERAELTGSLDDWSPPDTVQAVIRTRIDRLERHHQQVLRVASVVGREFDQSLLERAVSAHLDVPAALEQLCAQEMIQQTRLLPTPAYRFKHVLTQLVAYDTLMLQQRRKLHGLVGTTLEARHAGRLDEHVDSLAYHFHRSDDPDKAIAYLEQAGDRAVHAFALVNGRTQYWRALGLIESLAPSAELSRKRIDLTLKWAAASQYTPTLTHLQALERSRELAEELQDPRRLAHTVYWHGRMLYVLGHMTRARADFEQLGRFLETLDDPELAARYLAFMGRYHWHVAEYERAREGLERAAAAMSQLGIDDELVYIRTLLGVVLGWMGRFDEAIALLEGEIATARELENPTRESAALVFLGMVEALRGNWARALEVAARGGEQAERLVNAAIAGLGRWTCGYATFMQGHRAEGFALMEDIPHWPKSGRPGNMLIFRSWLAEMHALAGSAPAARSTVEQGQEMARDTGQRTGLPVLHRAAALAGALRKRGGADAARQSIAESLREAESVGARPDRAIALYRHAELLHGLGEEKAATALARQAREQFSEMGMTWWRDQVQALLKR